MPTLAPMTCASSTSRAVIEQVRHAGPSTPHSRLISFCAQSHRVGSDPLSVHALTFAPARRRSRANILASILSAPTRCFRSIPRKAPPGLLTGLSVGLDWRRGPALRGQRRTGRGRRRHPAMHSDRFQLLRRAQRPHRQSDLHGALAYSARTSSDKPESLVLLRAPGREFAN